MKRKSNFNKILILENLNFYFYEFQYMVYALEVLKKILEI